MRDSPHFLRLLTRQVLLLVLLISGYSGFYLCRSNFSTTLPLLQSHLVEQGYSEADAVDWLGILASLGIFAYALGKFFSGGLAERIGGRPAFLGGMLGSILFTLLFAVGGTLPWFTLAWVGNRAVQSLGWPGMVKLCGRWFSFARYGTVMGLISLSYLFGDAAARLFLGWIIGSGVSWSGVFLVSAAVLTGFLLLCHFGVRETPRELGLSEPPPYESSIYGDNGDKPGSESWRGLLGPLLRSPAFWYICMLSLGCTLLREILNTWTPTYFKEAIELSPATAALASATPPFCGGLSVLAAGLGHDRLGPRGRAAVIMGGLGMCGFALWALAGIDRRESLLTPIILIGSVAVFLIGPYSYLAGALSLDLGGRRGGALACGIIDGVGYLGAVLAGAPVRRLSVELGWHGAFRVLAAVALVTSAVGFLFWVEQRRVGSTVLPCKSSTN